jgi:predicted Zn-dependent protease
VGGLVLLSALASTALHLRPVYRKYKETRGLRQAVAFARAGDVASASVSARQVLQLNPSNAGACRFLAELAERCHSPAAVEWRQRMVELEPTLPNQLGLAAAVLRFQRPPYALAERVLHEVASVAGEVPAYHVLCAELSLKLSQVTEAIRHFEQAERLDPSNCLHRFNLAVLRSQSTDAETQTHGRRVLQEICKNPKLRSLALRWLATDALRRDVLDKAEGYSNELLLDSRANWDDQLQHLAILQRSRSASFSNFLDWTTTRAGTNLTCIYATCEWMGAHGLADDALKWLRGFKEPILVGQPIPLARANLHLAKKDWPALEEFLSGQKWDELEFLRLALSAQAAWGLRHPIQAESLWRSASRSAGARLSSLCLLVGLANDWHRDANEILWQIVSRFPREEWAVRELEGHYLDAGDTRALQRMYASQAGSSNRTNLLVRNNFAATSMLLKVDLARAHQTANDLYKEHPEDIVIASTYAYSLHLRGQTADALAVLRAFDSKLFQVPEVALYYGVILADAGEAVAAQPYLTCAAQGRLLPEEKELLAKTKSRRDSER